MKGIRDQATVLIVDDERAYVDAYATWLEESYDVRTATDGNEALEQFDESVDVVLLDRRMPDLSGDEVLDEIHTRGFDCRVAMVTAVDPEPDIVDMAFDDYLVKPVSRADLRDTVDELLTRATLDEKVQECFALASKKTALENATRPEELESREEYRELTRRLAEIESRVDATIEELVADGSVVDVYRDIQR